MPWPSRSVTRRRTRSSAGPRSRSPSGMPTPAGSPGGCSTPVSSRVSPWASTSSRPTRCAGSWPTQPSTGRAGWPSRSIPSWPDPRSSACWPTPVPPPCSPRSRSSAATKGGGRRWWSWSPRQATRPPTRPTTGSPPGTGMNRSSCRGRSSWTGTPATSRCRANRGTWPTSSTPRARPVTPRRWRSATTTPRWSPSPSRRGAGAGGCTPARRTPSPGSPSSTPR